MPASEGVPDPGAWRADEAERVGEFRRFLALSVGLHLLAVAGLLLAPERAPRVVMPGAVAVDLVAGLPAPPREPAAPKPAPRPTPPKAAPKPAPPPPPPTEKVVLPEKPSPPPPKPRAKPKPRARPRPAPSPPPQASYDDVLAELRREAGETAPAPTPAARSGPATGTGAAGPGRPVPPQVAAWLRDAQAHVERMWVRPPGFDGSGLVAVVEIELAADGRLLGEPRLLRPSPNPVFNDNALRAAAKASPYPPPPEPGRWTVTFAGDRL